jgi:hypothetical protein
MKSWPGQELDAALLELADADLRALQVRHDADFAPELLRTFAYEPCALDVVGGDAVREVEPYHVHACGEHARHDGGRAARGPERCDDLGIARHDGKP